MSAALKFETSGAFLGVERSVTGRRWRTREADLGLVEALRRRFTLPEIAARLMAVRGIGWTTPRRSCFRR
jgi:single-stranded-DNA-specific exonuclease